MTIVEARANIGKAVEYRAAGSRHLEHGLIHRVDDFAGEIVFVCYGKDRVQATYARDLRLLS